MSLVGVAPALLALQADGFNLSPTTFGVVAAVVVSLVGAISFLFRWATSNQAREIARLQEDNEHLLETLIDVLRTAHRSTDVADEAARELVKRRARKPR